jgi:flagellar motor switch protein FliM
VVSNAILRRLTVDFGRGSRHPSETRALLQERVRRIRFGTTLQLPAVRISAKEIENLVPGSLIRLKLPAQASPLLCAGGQVFTAAQLVRQGSHRAARLERAVASQEGREA